MVFTTFSYALLFFIRIINFIILFSLSLRDGVGKINQIEKKKTGERLHSYQTNGVLTFSFDQ